MCEAVEFSTTIPVAKILNMDSQGISRCLIPIKQVYVFIQLLTLLPVTIKLAYP